MPPQFVDNHMHIDPINGEGIRAVKKFQNSGGGYIFLVTKFTASWNILLKDEESFKRLFQNTIFLADEINDKTEVKAFPVIGVHPAEFAHMCKTFSTDKALEIGKKAMDIACRYIREGQAVAIGEVGRPHYEVEEVVLSACMELLRYTFKLTKDLDCAIQLHTESSTPEHFEEFNKLATTYGVRPSKVVKHYSPPLIKVGEKFGIFPSLIASKENISHAIKEGNRFLMESDYIDDLKRPGAVVGPKSVPRVSQRLYEEEILTEEDLWKIHKDNVEKVYGVSLD
ncbi:MAG: TatD family hydrolase [Candidatus Hydrothermarchaeales archaeon]